MSTGDASALSMPSTGSAADLDVGRGVNRLPVGIHVMLAAAGMLFLIVASLIAAILVVTRLNHSEIVLKRSRCGLWAGSQRDRSRRHHNRQCGTQPSRDGRPPRS
jgi:hypothetical protein